jgi:GTP 3',8-cyclase
MKTYSGLSCKLISKISIQNISNTLGRHVQIKMNNKLIDNYQRRISYSRIPVTDRCNLRCIYCMPPEGIELFEKKHILTFEEMVRFSRIAVNLGMKKIKITGGKPLVRRGVVDLIASLSKIGGLEDLSITTNGILLEDSVYELWESGLRRINVSLDTLDYEKYKEITRGGDVNKVKKGIRKALEAGFKVKVNTVVLDYLSEDEIIKLIEFGNEWGLEVRFIEFMPLCGNGWNNDHVIPLSEVEEIIENRYELLYLGNNGVADRYSIDDGKGTIGFIRTMSKPFYSSYSRLRLTSRGSLRPCLFSSLQVNIFELLRKQAPDRDIVKSIKKAIYLKPAWNPVLSGNEVSTNVLIRNVGG